MPWVSSRESGIAAADLSVPLEHATTATAGFSRIRKRELVEMTGIEPVTS
jgi:hypothetical protein